MNKTTTTYPPFPVAAFSAHALGHSGAADTQSAAPEVLTFRTAFEGRSLLDELIRTGAQKMLQAAINAEVDDFLLQHSQRRDDLGRRMVVRNGQLPEREILIAAGPLQVRDISRRGAGEQLAPRSGRPVLNGPANIWTGTVDSRGKLPRPCYDSFQLNTSDICGVA